jgi:hypothetical protein
MLTVNSDGSYSLSYSFTNGSHIFGYDYLVAVTLISPTGTVFAISHSYHLTRNAYDSGTITGFDSRIAADWNDLAGSTTNGWAITGLDTLSYASWLVPDLRAKISSLNGVQNQLGPMYSLIGGNGDTQIST